MSSQFVEKADKLLKETEEWKKTWKHGSKPCEEWVANEGLDGIGYCKHYVDARYKKFKNKIVPLFELTQSLKRNHQRQAHVGQCWSWEYRIRR